MSAKKGHPKYGGRQKGTPNRHTSEMKDLMSAVLADYMSATNGNAPSLRRDFAELLPAERVRALAALAGYIMPKQQSVSIEEQTQIEMDAIDRWIETAPDEAIEAIASKIIELQEQNKNQHGQDS